MLVRILFSRAAFFSPGGREQYREQDASHVLSVANVRPT